MDGDPEQSTCFHELFMSAEQKVVETQNMALQLLGEYLFQVNLRSFLEISELTYLHTFFHLAKT